MKTKSYPKVLVLIGSGLPNLNTLATLITGNINIVGAVIANQKKGGINFSFLKNAIKKQGFLNVVFQIFERIFYKILNSKKDSQIRKNIFDEEKINSTISNWSGEIFVTDNYQAKETFEWIKSKSPDIIVIHTPYWVGKKIRNLVNGNIIGGHPGIVPLYRGIHSSFWAAYKNDFDNIGYSVFWVDAGVDTGDLILQKKITPAENDSYITLNWKGMKGIAEDIVTILSDNEKGVPIPRTTHQNIPENSLYTHPNIFQYIRYRLKQRLIR